MTESVVIRDMTAREPIDEPPMLANDADPSESSDKVGPFDRAENNDIMIIETNDRVDVVE